MVRLLIDYGCNVNIPFPNSRCVIVYMAVEATESWGGGGGTWKISRFFYCKIEFLWRALKFKRGMAPPFPPPMLKLWMYLSVSVCVCLCMSVCLCVLACVMCLCVRMCEVCDSVCHDSVYVRYTLCVVLCCIVCLHVCKIIMVLIFHSFMIIAT